MENHTADNSGKKVEDRKITSPCHRKDYLYQLWQNSSILRIVWNHFLKWRCPLWKILLSLWALECWGNVMFHFYFWMKKKKDSGMFRLSKFLSFGVKQIQAGSQLCAQNWKAWSKQLVYPKCPHHKTRITKHRGVRTDLITWTFSTLH